MRQCSLAVCGAPYLSIFVGVTTVSTTTLNGVRDKTINRIPPARASGRVSGGA
ncbi:MAG: hypothetical protein HXS42_03045 [Theionarchaea archaeon]|nr:hypothetical protein [Theionarchaea archaeon]